MSDHEIEALVRELESLGVEFRVVPRMDGSLRLSCWRTQTAWPNRDRINHLLAERIESSPEVSGQIAELISKRPTPSGASDQSNAPPERDRPS
jgi:hypothetical protein